MTGRSWVKISPHILYDYEFSILPDKEKWAHLSAAFAGRPSTASPFVRRGRDRAYQANWRQSRAAVFERDGFKCRYCGADDRPLECDHMVPLARGGSDNIENLVTACLPCNRSKAGKLLSEWRNS